MQHFEKAGPKLVSGPGEGMPVLVFTDGACEEAGTTVGGVIIEVGKQRECFGARLPDWMVDQWKTKESQIQVIGQAEIYPLLLARLTWSARLQNRRVIYFIDNEAARIGLVRAYSPVLPSLRLIMDCLGWDYTHNSQGWYARVPSYSNCADDPSRMVVPADGLSKVVVPIFPPGFGADVVLG